MEASDEALVFPTWSTPRFVAGRFHRRQLGVLGTVLLNHHGTKRTGPGGDPASSAAEIRRTVLPDAVARMTP